MNPKKMNDLLVLSRIAGLLDGLSSIQGAQLNKTACMRLEEASERLTLYIGDQFPKDVTSDEGTEEAEWPKAYQ